MVRRKYDRRHINAYFSNKQRILSLTNATKNSSQGLSFLTRNTGRLGIGTFLNTINIRQIGRGLTNTGLLNTLSPPSNVGANKFTTTRHNSLGAKLHVLLALFTTNVRKRRRRLITRAVNRATSGQQIISNHHISASLIYATTRR